MIEPFEGK